MNGWVSERDGYSDIPHICIYPKSKTTPLVYMQSAVILIHILNEYSSTLCAVAVYTYSRLCNGGSSLKLKALMYFGISAKSSKKNRTVLLVEVNTCERAKTSISISGSVLNAEKVYPSIDGSNLLGQCLLKVMFVGTDRIFE